MANGGWRMANGEWRMANGERAKSFTAKDAKDAKGNNNKIE
jgi:hypothetical protein